MGKLRNLISPMASSAGAKAKHEYIDRTGAAAIIAAIKEKFASIVHTHSASDISTGAVSIAHGGTGQTSALSAAKALGRGYGTCSTAAATAAKIGTLSGFVRQTGAIVAIRFTYTNTASSPTLNVNSTGAAAIYSCYTNAAIVNGNITAGMTALFVFNGMQWVLLNPAEVSTSKT